MSMFECRVEFVNELGNQISMTLVDDDRGITISATGPTSTVEHTWTQIEAEKIAALITGNYNKLDDENCIDVVVRIR